ncbi:hypothetical protein [Nocardiopsis sp. FR26]|uniref:hypothetical protein n=1 Tax=Nocardiopsis sp. FR26 TaxID=2605987 RepID=UPI00135B8FFC|nr:hypothetical protein [Nocardiopsis sp. FR26]
MSWEIVLPAGLPMMNANHRPHPLQKARDTAKVRTAAQYAALSSGMPRLDRAWVIAYIHPKANYAKWDPGNFYPMVKAALDGVVDAGLLVDDSHEFVSGPDMRPAPKVPKLGQLRLVFAAPWRCRCGHDVLEHLDGPCHRPACGCTQYREPAPTPGVGVAGVGGAG